MADLTKKKRGRPRKPVFVVRLADVQKEWNRRLRRAGNPEEKRSKDEIPETLLPPTTRDAHGRRVRPTKVTLDSINKRSWTQFDPVMSLLEMAAADTSIVLSSKWEHYLEYMDVIAKAWSPKEKGETLKQLFLEDARSRSGEHPPKIPPELGTPAEFKERLADHELEIRYKASRREQVISIRVYPLPPHVDEDLDETKDPRGHWEGLKWLPDSQK